MFTEHLEKIHLKLNTGICNMWPHVEAQKIIEKITDNSKVITFETGYGPSGAPHIGTIAEIIRTSYVRQAFFDLTGKPTRLICFSDDLDGLRKVPENLPKELLISHIGKSLCDIPNPYTDSPGSSFGQANINKMIQLIRDFGYTPIIGEEALTILRNGSATKLNEILCINSSDCYRSGIFNEMLTLISARVQDILDVILPTLGGTGGNRRETYCPFMPIVNDIVIQNLHNWSINDNIISWSHNDNRNSISILDGNCKLQWKVDWCMRWAALGIDYEMHGKDLQSSVQVGKAILEKLEIQSPITMQYELMLDSTGAKQSKSKGNGIDINDWVKYGIDRALNFYLTFDPSTARKVSHDTILTTNDNFIQSIRSFNGEMNELWYVYHNLPIPEIGSDLNFGNVLNLVNLINTDNAILIEKLIQEYHSSLTIENCPILKSIIGGAINYYIDVIQPGKNPRNASESEEIILKDLAETIKSLDIDTLDAEKIQFHIYECGKRHFQQKELKKFFQMIYEILLGSPQGPRLGTMIKIIGTDAFISLIFKGKKSC